MRLSLFFPLFPLFFLLLVSAPALAATPQETVSLLQKAIDGKDSALLEHYMDVNGVASKAADFVLNDPQALQAAAKTPAVALLIAGMGSDARAKDLVRALLASEAGSFVRQGVASGAFAGEARAATQRGSGPLSPLFADASRGRKEFGPARLLERGGKTARVSTSLYDAGTKQRYPLELRLEEQRGVWRVMEVLNVRELTARAAGG
jgi:hypothetical protein